jgi:crotonobetainyl-CoA:carnitine CoA-transferase CaiB-like acyl-CoA transferase
VSPSEEFRPLSGVRIVELTTFGFVPSGAAILADWGADVVKIEHPLVPDPMRGLVTALDPMDNSAVDTLMDHLNRGKRNIALDLSDPAGLDVFYELIRGADVFITSFLKHAQKRLHVSFEDLHAVNPRLIFAHGHGYGPRGPDAEQPGFDGIAYWARGGVGHALTFQGGTLARQRAGFGDVIGGLSVATGVSSALYGRTVTGEGCAVDVSLLAVACWQLAPDILTTSVTGRDVQSPAPGPDEGPYVTRDGRYVVVLLLLPHYLRNVLEALDVDPNTSEDRFAHFQGGVGPSGAEDEIRKAIASMTAKEVSERFQGKDIAWSMVQTPQEVIIDRQVTANEYVVPNPGDPRRLLVTAPIQFNQSPPSIAAGAPAQGQHTEEILAELGLDTERISDLLARRVAAQGKPGDWDHYGRLSRG